MIRTIANTSGREIFDTKKISSQQDDVNTDTVEAGIKRKENLIMDKLSLISGALFLAADIFAVAALAMPDWIVTDVGGETRLGLMQVPREAIIKILTPTNSLIAHLLSHYHEFPVTSPVFSDLPHIA